MTDNDSACNSTPTASGSPIEIVNARNTGSLLRIVVAVYRLAMTKPLDFLCSRDALNLQPGDQGGGLDVEPTPLPWSDQGRDTRTV